MSKVITRKRYIVIRNGTHIMCGLTRPYCFKPINNIGDTHIKTYSNKKKAISAFEKSLNKKIGGEYQVVEIEEVINIKGGESTLRKER